MGFAKHSARHSLLHIAGSLPCENAAGRPAARVCFIVAENGKSITVSRSESVSETVNRCLKQGIGTDSASESGNGKLSNTVCGNYGAVDATGARGAAFHRRRAPETSYSVRSQIWIFECTVLLMILQMVHYGDHCRPSGLSAGCATFF